MSLSTAALVCGFGLDLLVGELPDRWHPVAWFGRLVAACDRSWSYPRFAGTTLALGLPVASAVAVGAPLWAAAVGHPLAGVIAGGVVVFVTTSFRSLLTTVARVARLADEDLSEARAALPALAGRDTTSLDADHVRSASVESLAENLADGLVGPLLAFGIGAGVAGAVGASGLVAIGVASGAAVWLKAVNTMDSMLGYPDRAVGTGAARLDDLAMWLPARVTALVLALSFADPRAPARARAWTEDVASPNAGWPMGTIAAALSVRLAKPGHYVLNPDADPPTQGHVRRALGRAGLAGLAAYALAGVLAWS